MQPNAIRHVLIALTAVMLGATLAWAQAQGQAPEAPLWLQGGRPNAQARQAVALLAGADAEGLEPADYAAAELQRAVAEASQGEPLPPALASRLEGALELSMRRYIADLHYGRIDPKRVHQDFTLPPRNGLEPGAYLREAVRSNRLPEAVREAAPRLPMYASLRLALASYRALQSHPAWQQGLDRLPARKLEPGKPYAGLPRLMQRLVALGDLAPDAALPARYEGAVVEAVKAFQLRHGLEPDGVIGRATMEQLNATPAQRARQIELALERLRWTPLLQGPRMIVVNVPEFMLRAYEVRENGEVEVKAQMRVIVGKALRTRTPLFDEDMRYIEFSPYWNVPPSIARDELVPRLRKEPGYFAAEGFEFVGLRGQASAALSSEQLDAVLRGELRLRQRPGPKNALGSIKFVFPNNENIYLHDTPTPRLFERTQRDFSHGCIRVEDPLALAKFVLQEMPEWSDERIVAAMQKGESSTLRLPKPVPVLIAYGTTLVKGGRVHFYRDLYGHDQLLERALRLRPVTPTPPAAPASAGK